MYAIIEEGGRQFKVTSGDTINIDREVSPDQKTITFDRVLLIDCVQVPRNVGQGASRESSLQAEGRLLEHSNAS